MREEGINQAIQQQNIDDAIMQQCIIACCVRRDGIILSCLAVLLFVWLLVPTHSYLINWLLIGISLTIFRFGYTYWFQHWRKKQANSYHAHVFFAIMLLWGLCWAVATVQFFPELSTLEQAAWFAMFMAMIASSSSSHAVYLPAFFAFSLPYFLTMGYMVISEFPSSYHINGLVFLFVMVSQASSTRKTNHVLIESFKLRFENVELIDKLTHEKASAEKANIAKSKFLAAASHDLRQPLHGLTLFSAALNDALTDKKKAKVLIGRVNESVDALQSLFNALLDISRLDAGTLACEKSHFNSQTLFEKLDNDFSALATEKGVTLSWEMEPIAIYSDPTLLELILRNLVSNAIRYTEQGSVSVSIVVNNEQVFIEVKDTGIGIAKDKQQTIFDEFVQLHNPERNRDKGLGLGLSIVKRVCQLIDGDISLLSEAGQGSTFTITVAKGDANYISSSQKSELSIQADHKGGILVIDDEEPILAAMEALLVGWGYQVILATSDQNAITQLKTLNLTPDCIIADYRLSEDKTGIEALHVLY